MTLWPIHLWVTWVFVTFELLVFALVCIYAFEHMNRDDYDDSDK